MILCKVGLHAFRLERVVLVETAFSKLTLDCDVCRECRQMRKSHREQVRDALTEAALYWLKIGRVEYKTPARIFL